MANREEVVSIPYWLGSKLRDRPGRPHPSEETMFQSPIGWGLSCEETKHDA